MKLHNSTVTMFINYKKVLINVSYRAIAVFLGKLISISVIPILARYLLPKQFGEYNYLIVIAGYVTLLINFGFLAYGTREIAKNNEQAQNLVNEIISTRLFMSLCILLILILLSFCLSMFNSYLLFFIIVLCSETMFIDFYFYGKKNVFLPSLSHVLSQSFFLLSVIASSHYDFGFKSILISFSLSKVFESAVLLFYYKFIIKENFSIHFNIKSHLDTIKKIFPIGFGNKLSFIKASIPTVIIPQIINFETLGYYSGFMKFVLIINAGLQVIFLPLGPFIAEKRNSKSLRKHIKTFIASLILLGIIITSVSIIFKDLLINILLGPEFEIVKELFPAGALLVLLTQPLYIGIIVLANYIGHDKWFLKISLISFGIALISMPILIRLFEIYGAFIGNFIASIIFIILLSKKLLNDSIPEVNNNTINKSNDN